MYQYPAETRLILKKPDVRHLTETIRMANIKNYECWFIGDSESDALCAKRANSKLILLKHGYSKDNLYSLEQIMF